MSKDDIITRLAQAVVSCQTAEVEQVVRAALTAGLSPHEVIKGLSEGMREMGRLWTEMEVFLPEVMAAADAFYAGLHLAKPAVPVGSRTDQVGTLVLGTIYGDIHSVGKDVVVPVFEAENFKVVDLGTDVSAAQFVQAVVEHKPDILGLGTYMSETFRHVAEVVRALVDAGVRDQVIVICGGAVADAEIARRMGADDAFTDAWVAVEAAKHMLETRKR